MNHRLIPLLAALPMRRIYLVGAGMVLIAAALLYTAARPSFKALQTVRAERAQHLRQGTDSIALGQAKRQLTAGIERMSANRPGDARSAEQLAVQVVAQLDRISVRRGVVLSSVALGAARRVMSFEELAFDIEVKGSYRDVIGWLQDLEGAMDNLAIVRFEMRPNDGGKAVEMKARVAIYR
jgi:Tfp pilus assembly protein PilO